MIQVPSHARSLLAITAFLLVAATPRLPAQPAPATSSQALAPAPAAASGSVVSPDTFFGFRMGADRRLASAGDIERYFEQVARTSARVRLVEIGSTTDGHRTVAAIVSSPDNVARLDRIQAANRRLADPRQTTDSEAAALARTQPVVVAIGATIHATEIGGSQAMNELLYRLATGDDETTQTVISQAVVILIPMLNPDGHRLVTDWYDAHKGTAFDGGPMPWLYHRYAGHDINRDGFMMNLAESRNLSAFFYRQWHPQVFLTIHEMGQNGPRFFVPPNTDPIDPNYDPLIWRTAGLLGGAMSFELQRAGRKGVLTNGMYDYYWPGYEDSAPLGHNTVCLLTEVASVRIASPITLAPGDLRGGQKGLLDYRPQINFPDPWPGGAWTLRDIVDYDLTAVDGLLKAAALYREAIVRNFYDMGRRAVDAGRSGGPYAFVIPPTQHDPFAAASLRELLLQGQVEIQRATAPFRAEGVLYPAGTDVIAMAQPFRAYVKTLLEVQRYPMPLDRAGSSERPYDVTGWTLPLQMGVDVRTIERPFELPPATALTDARGAPAPVGGERRPGHYVVEGAGTAGAMAASRFIRAGIPLSWSTTARELNGHRYEVGSLLVPASTSAVALVAEVARDLGSRVDGVRGPLPSTAVAAIGRARVGVYAPWFDNISEGWTRWLLDRYGFRYTTLRPADVRGRPLRERVDVIVMASAPTDLMLNGNRPGVYPPEYSDGVGTEGMAALQQFVAEGGTLIALDQASDLAIRTFDLPLRDATRADNDRLFCPGSLVRLHLDTAHPLAFGMPADTAAFFSFSAAFEPDPAGRPAGHQNSGREVMPPAGLIETVATYGDKDVLLSGYIEGADVIARRGAVVSVRVGAGRVILFGFQPHHRGQSLATFRLLFNALLTAPTASAR